MKKYFLILFLIFIASFSLVGCGQTGKLYLPQQDSSPPKG